MINHDKIYKIDSTGKVRVYSITQDEDKYKMVTGVLDGAMVESKWTTAKPKNVGRSNETSPEDQASAEIVSKYTKKLNEGYFLTLEDAKSTPEGKYFQPMLATEWDKVKDKDKQFPLLADPKLDGMRMTKDKNEAISRKGKPILTVPHITESLEEFFESSNVRLDGEIYNHEYKEDFNTLMSVARRAKPDEEDLKLSKEKLQYHVYDTFMPEDPLASALSRKQWLDLYAIDTPYVKIVEWEIVNNEAELKAVKIKHLLAGYEGTIIRSLDAPYINKRTKHLMKIKEFITEEYPGVDDCIVSGKGNKSDIAGAIVVNVNGVIVSCGIRGSWKYCKTLLDNKEEYRGAKVTVRHFGKTPDGSLRFPVCIDINRPD